MLRAGEAYPVAEDESICQMLAWHISKQEQFTREPLSVRHMTIWAALAEVAHSPKSSATLVAELATRANSVLQAQGESLMLTPHAVGNVLTTFGMNGRNRTNRGWALEFDQELRKKIHVMIKRQGVETNIGAALLKACPNCQFCKEVQL